MYDRETFTHDGQPFRVRIERDDHMGEPWKEHDGHGIVSDWTTRHKFPRERELCSDCGARRFYDVKASTALAKRDQWGLGDEELGKLAAKLGRAPTPGEVTARAVEMDFDYLRGWCNDEWEWLCVGVEWLDRDGEPRATEWLGGIDGDGPYTDECARELAEQLLYEPRKVWRAALAQARKDRDTERLCAVLAAPLRGIPA